MPSNAWTNQQASKLLQLPAELRLQVYECVVPRGTPFTTAFDRSYLRGNTKVLDMLLSLLWVCRQIREEAHDCIWNSIELKVSVPPSGLYYLPPNQRIIKIDSGAAVYRTSLRHIRHVRIVTPLVGARPQAPSLRHFINVAAMLDILDRAGSLTSAKCGYGLTRYLDDHLFPRNFNFHELAELKPFYDQAKRIFDQLQRRGVRVQAGKIDTP